jgi:hypothetical protein
MTTQAFFLGAFTKLRKATISFVMSARASVCPHDATGLPLDGFSLNLMFYYFSRNCEENLVSLKPDKNNGYFT